MDVRVCIIHVHSLWGGVINIVLFIGWFWIDIHKPSPTKPSPANTVGFHNFNLRIFNLRVSNPNKLIVDVFVDTMSDFNVPGSRPKKTL